MKRNYRFIPLKLIEKKKEFGISGVSNINPNIKSISMEEFNLFLSNLVSMKSDDIPFYIVRFDINYFRMLVRFISKPHPEYPLENCFRAIELKFRKEFIDIAYNEFQQTLGNIEFVDWFKRMSIIHNEYKIINRIPIIELAKYIVYEEPAKLFVKYAREYNKSITDIANEFAIRDQTQLRGLIFVEWLLSANKKEYLSLDQGLFLSKIETLTLKDQGRLLNNYLNEVPISNANEKYLESIYKKYRTPTEIKTQFWEYISSENIIKFYQWVNINNINQILGNDERSRYWKRYSKVMKSTYVQESRGQIALDFGSFVVIEFTNIGAAYFYSKENFDKYFKKYFGKYNSTSDGNLKDIGLMIDKYSHTGYWQYRFDDYMAYLGVKANER